jgi:16S rRNA (adenine1518-N6/adenine1519-N6)-dimethyltransferase
VSGSQVTLARMREFGIRPDRDLGQHFLVDDNVLEVAGRLLPLHPDDVVLEVGAGLGVLTVWLARRVALVHAVEVDRRLEAALTATLAGAGNVRVVWADAARLDPAELDPPPGVLVANLPYAVATPVIIRALPAIERFCVMVQREIADRLFARPGTKAYGAVSVLVQLACERLGRRTVSRRVFAPEPNVDSALVAFRRREDAELGDEWAWTSRVVHAAFAHRRKTLGNALQLAGLPPPPADIAGLRAEQLPPERLAGLAQGLR